MSAPTRLVDLLDGALCSWAAPARAHARLCAATNPDHPEITCWRLAGHTGLLHVSETTAWTEEDTPMPPELAALAALYEAGARVDPVATRGGVVTVPHPSEPHTGMRLSEADRDWRSQR